jgi:hypothetical protein
MCLGRRIAETEGPLIILYLISKFNFEFMGEVAKDGISKLYTREKSEMLFQLTSAN